MRFLENQKYFIHPALDFHAVLWPPEGGYPESQYFKHLWVREALLRQTAPGHLICTWTTGGFCEPTSGNVTVLMRSEDYGLTWKPAGRFEHPYRGLFTTELFIPAENEIHAFLQTYDPWRWFSHNQMLRTVSRDGGKTWSAPESLPGGMPPGWMNVGIRHSVGRWILPMTWPELIGPEWAEPSVGRAPADCRVGDRILPITELPRDIESWVHYEQANNWCHRNHRYPAGVALSDDNGGSFRLRGYIRGGKTGHLIEPQVVELSDGTVAMLLRSRGEGVLLRSDSLDRGETWSVPVKTSIPNPSSKVNVLRHSDGRIFLIHNPSGDKGNLMTARTPLSVWMSDDDMETWSVKMDLVAQAGKCERGLNYPSSILDEEGDCLRFVWEDAYSIFYMSLPLATLSPESNRDKLVALDKMALTPPTPSSKRSFASVA